MLRKWTVDGGFAGQTARGSSPGPVKRKRLAALTLALVAIAIICLLALPAAAVAMPVQFFYVPFPEDQLLTLMDTINTAAADPVTSYITIAAVANHTIIYYDQWENGYDIDIANTYNIYTASNTGGTQIWGDGNPANGAPPGIPGDVINAGTVIHLTNDIYVATRQSIEYDFDGGDKIAATKTVAMTRSSWAATSRTLFAGCVEVFDTNSWGTDYRAPIGTNVANSYDMFQLTALSIMAGEDGATISVDANNDGDYLDANDKQAVVLTEGQSTYVTGVVLGARVVSNKPVQVDIYSGDIGSNYESRDSALMPTSWWDDSYYTPVSTYNVSSQDGDERTTVWLYNPGSSAITVTYQRRSTTGTLTSSNLSVPAGSTGKQILENGAAGVGSRFFSTPATVSAAANSTGTTGDASASTLTFSHTTPAGANRLLIVGVAVGNDANTQCDVGSVTFGGTPLKLVGRVMAPTGGGGTPNTRPQTEIWALANPSASTTANVVVTLNGSRPFLAGATTFTGADISRGLSSALGRFASNSANTSRDQMVDVGTNVGQVVYNVVATARVNNSDPGGYSVDGGETKIWGDILARAAASGTVLRMRSASSIETATGFNTNIDWRAGTSLPWAISAVPVKPANGAVFYAYSTTDSASTNGGTYNQAWDWSYTMIPESMLTTEALVGLGIGRDPDSGTNPLENGNPVWVTPVGNGDSAATVYYDFDADPTTGAVTDASGFRCDGSLSLRELEQARIYDTNDRDQSGTLVYTLDPQVRLAVAWGQDPETASAGAPGLDVGTSVPPMPEFTAGKDGLLYDNPALPGIEGDKDGDGYITAGDEIEWPITVVNVSRLPVPDIIVKDDVPANTAYVPNSTVVCWDLNEDGVYETEYPIADDLSGTAFPLDVTGYNYGTYYGSLPVGHSFTVRFRVTINNPVTVGTNAIVNNGTATAFGWIDPVGDLVYLRARLGDFVWYDENNDGIQDVTEGGMPGVTVTLYDGEGRIVRYDNGEQITTVTDDTGRYDFMGLLPGSYRVQFLLPLPTADSYTEISPRNATTDDVDSDVYPSNDPVNPSRTDMVTLGGGQWDNTVDCGVMLFVTNPTQAVVGSFAAYLSAGRVAVSWETTSESGTAGFYLERQDGDRWTDVNERLVPAQFGSPTGGFYSVVDPVASPGEPLTYRLVEVETSGSRVLHGPYRVVASLGLPHAAVADVIARGNATAWIPKMAKTVAEHPWMPWLPPFKPANATQMKIEVTETGLYRVDATDIVDALGVTVERASELIRTMGVKLTNKDRSVAYLQADDGSSLYFFGEAIDSIYTWANVYWLSIARGTVMASGGRATYSTPPATDFVDSIHVEQNLESYTDGFHDPESDFWLWSFLFAGEDGFDTQTIDVDAPGAIEGTTLSVSLLGITTIPQTNEHHVQVRLNGTLLGDDWWTGVSQRTAQFAIPSGLLNAGANQVDVTAVLDGDVDYSIIAVDSLDLVYRRSTTAVDDALLLTAEARGQATVNGLSSPAALVLDLGDPLAPQVARIVSSGGDAGNAWVTFTTLAARPYYATTLGAALRPAAMSAVEPLRFAGAGAAGAGYIVVTHPSLLTQATALADYRATQGLTSMVVTTNEIYDNFNFGIQDPRAIQTFISYAISRMKPSPLYVVFAGDGSFDYKDYQGYGDSLVPPLMVDTDGGLAPSDNLLADVVDSDGVPDVAIGRIPALDGADLQNALAKIVAYESAATGSWRRSAVLAADNLDPDAGDFAADSDSLAALLPKTFTVTKAYLDTVDVATARTAVLNGFADNLWINYTGHSGIDNWAAEFLLEGADVPGLVASARLPFVTALTCVAGQFALPGADCLSESLVMQPGAGAIAVFSPTAKEENDLSVRLGSAFAGNMFGGLNSVAMGRVVRAGLEQGAALGLPRSLLATYCLLGDPALKVKW